MLVLPLLDRQIALLVEGLGSRLVDSILVFGNLVMADIVGCRSIVVMEVEPQ